MLAHKIHKKTTGIKTKMKKKNGQKKIEKVMSEYKSGKLKSSSGGKVTSRKQAVAIAMSEAGMSKKKRR